MNEVKLERTTVHDQEPDRNKMHIFKIVNDKANLDRYEVTGITMCGKRTFVPLRRTNSKDIRCKRCFPQQTAQPSS